MGVKAPQPVPNVPRPAPPPAPPPKPDRALALVQNERDRLARRLDQIRQIIENVDNRDPVELTDEEMRTIRRLACTRRRKR